MLLFSGSFMDTNEILLVLTFPDDKKQQKYIFIRLVRFHSRMPKRSLHMLYILSKFSVDQGKIFTFKSSHMFLLIIHSIIVFIRKYC